MHERALIPKFLIKKILPLKDTISHSDNIFIFLLENLASFIHISFFTSSCQVGYLITFKAHPQFYFFIFNNKSIVLFMRKYVVSTSQTSLIFFFHSLSPLFYSLSTIDPVTVKDNYFSFFLRCSPVASRILRHNSVATATTNTSAICTVL